MNYYVIGLQRAEQRLQDRIAHLKDGGFDAKPFYGFDGSQIQLKPLPYPWDDPNNTNYFIHEKHVGMNLSHMALWRLGLALNESLCIFEDDCVLNPHAKGCFDACFGLLPNDWDIFFPAHCCVGNSQRQQISGMLYRLFSIPYCTHWYCINIKALPKLISQVQLVDSPIDIALHKRFQGVNVYAAIPRMAEQLNTDISP